MKKLILSILFLFALAIGTSQFIQAQNQEPVKTEKADKKTCDKDCKKECCKEKKSDCKKEKCKSECSKKKM